MTPSKKKAKHKLIVTPPVDGWKPHTVYLVRVQHFFNNPEHYALLHVGFLNDDNTPGAYSAVWQNAYDEATDYHKLYSLKVVKELCEL